jgi:excisionase family DNA binding protein
MKTQTISHKRSQRLRRTEGTKISPAERTGGNGNNGENAAAGIVNGQSQIANEERLLTRVELARALHVGSATVDRMIAAKSIPVLRFRKVVRFRLADVVKAMAAPDENFEQKVAETGELRK